MTNSRKRVSALAVVLFLVGVTGGMAADRAKPAANTVAVVAGTPVTQEELDQAVGNRLIRLRTEEYNLRRAALEEVIADRLMALEAKRRGVTTEELARTEIDAKVTLPAPGDLETLYEGMKDRFGGMSKEDALVQMAEGMRRQKTVQRRTEFINSLRGLNGVKVLMEAPRTTVAAVGRMRGNEQAPITIVEFSDFECNFCSRASATLKRVESTYGDKVRVVFRDYPLPIHRGATRAAEAAQCAGDQGKFWEMHDRLFAKGGAIAETDLRKFANEAGVDGVAFEQCLSSGKHTATWKASQEEGARLGVASTPTFFINGRMISGAMPYETFAKVIDEELDRTAAKSAQAGSR
jgi:protein-disulfide isomerase